ncbi:MAG: tetratricopeptide repeat protein [Bdellovibrionota bacterium]
MSFAQAGSVRGLVDVQGETVHFEFEGQNQWTYEVKRKFDDKNKLYFEFTLPSLTAQSVKDLQGVKNALISKVVADVAGPDSKTILKVYPQNEKVDFFDYLTDQPSRLVVDLYMGDEDSASKAVPTSPIRSGKSKPTAKSDSKDKTKATVAKKDSRAPAMADSLTITPFGSITAAPRAGLFDGSDPFYERFNIKDYEVKEDAIIRSKYNYYIPFPPLEIATTNWENVKNRQDSYQIEPKEGKENKDARLIARLFERKDGHLFLKTYDWFVNAYPESSYLDALTYMKGDMLLEMWRQDNYRKSIADKELPAPTPDKWFTQAIDAYKDALRKYPKSPLAERVSLKVGILLYEKKDYFTSLRSFNEHVLNPDFGDEKVSLSKNMARMAQGQSYMHIGKAAEALEVYDQIEKESSLESMRAEAAYRRGDVYYQNKKYVEAMAEYQKALAKYGKFEKDYPQAVYHQGEAQFWLGNYRDSLNAYREFIRKFPSNSEAPFATTRVGELLAMLGADSTRVMGAFLETFFRFGENPKTIIARIHMTSQKMKGMKPVEVEIAANQILALSKQLDLPKIDQFATVMISDGYSKRNDHQKAIDLLVKYYQDNPSSVEKEIFQQRIITNINDKLQGEVDRGEFMKVLRTHQRYADNWLKPSVRLDTPFNVGRAFEQAGVPQESEIYYKKVLNQLYSLAGTSKAKEASILERLPTEQEVLLRLGQVAFQKKDYGQSLEFIRQLKKPDLLNEDGQIERIDLVANLLDKKGDSETAIMHLKELVQTWKGVPAKVAQPYLRLAQAEVKVGKTKEALRSLARIDEIHKDSGAVNAVTHAASLKLAADIQMKSGNTDDAIEAIEKLIKTYGEKTPYASYRYRLGNLYFQKGDLQKAKIAWNDLNAQGDKFWAGLAQEQMNSQKWNDEYKRYLQRIPATANR